MRLRRFAGRRVAARPVLICAPFALHGATIADFAKGHSLIEALQRGGIGPMYVTEWRSATPQMRFLSIDALLADLNVAIDEVGAVVDLIGICQGGWMAVAYAARFPEKVRRLVIAGAPIDVAAGDSPMSRVAKITPRSVFEDLVSLGDGLILGQRAISLWGPPTVPLAMICDILQIPDVERTAGQRRLADRFRTWYATTVDLPGVFYLQVVNWLFKENRLARNMFVALGRPADLPSVTHPTFLLAAEDDEVVAPEQLFAASRRMGTPPGQMRQVTVKGPHLSLFMGRRTLTETWPTIAAWLCATAPDADRAHSGVARSNRGKARHRS